MSKPGLDPSTCPSKPTPHTARGSQGWEGLVNVQTLGLGGSQVQELLSLWSWGVSPSLYVDVFTNLEALQAPHY